MVATDNAQGRVVQRLDGDQEAFAELIRDHQRMVHSLCYRMTGSLADADDLAQETFIHAYRHIETFRAEARFSSWLYRIAVNQCLNWQKSNRRHQRLQQEWLDQQQTPAQDNPGRAQQVQEALLKLNPAQRAAIILTVYNGLNHAEAARVLGCSETTISWRLFMARRHLKRLLKGALESSQ